MVKYVKKNGIEKPVWIDPLFPAFRGLLDAVLQKVKVQSKSNLCVGGFIERTTREATLYEQAATTYLLKTLEPLSLELEVARKKSAAPPAREHGAGHFYYRSRSLGPPCSRATGTGRCG